MSEPDDEVVRALLRKRAGMWVGRDDPFEDWATEFGVDGVRYCLPWRDAGYFFARPDHWSERVYFRPAPHLLDTLREIIREVRKEQAEREKADTVRRILA
jgi:hypothetical protein